MQNCDIIIIGAGIGGLTAALALHHAGHRVRIFEQAPELGEVGAGVMLTPNAMRVFRRLGLEKAIAEVSVAPAFTAVWDHRDGHVLSTSVIGADSAARHGAPYYYIHRADLHRILAGAVRGNDSACLALGRTFTAWEMRAGRAVAQFADGAQAIADLLLGCDGIKSRLRTEIAAEVPTRFTGNVAWRGLVPTDRLRPSMCQPESIIWVGPGRHLVRYAVRGGAVINYVALAEQAAWQDEGWMVRAEVADVLKEFAGWHPDAVDLIAATPPETCFKWGLFDRAPLPVWSKDSATLLGDAAHPMLPFMAQGAAMAIEDAAVLTVMLERHDDIAGALAAYQAERLPRTAWVQAQSRANQNLYHRATSAEQFDDDRALRSERLYGYDAFAPAAVGPP